MKTKVSDVVQTKTNPATPKYIGNGARPVKLDKGLGGGSWQKPVLKETPQFKKNKAPGNKGIRNPFESSE